MYQTGQSSILKFCQFFGSVTYGHEEPRELRACDDELTQIAM